MKTHNLHLRIHEGQLSHYGIGHTLWVELELQLNNNISRLLVGNGPMNTK